MNDASASVAVLVERDAHPEASAAARALVEEHALPAIDEADARRGRGFDIVVAATRDRLELRVVRGEAGVAGGLPVFVDFSQVNTTSNAGRTLRQPIARAVGLRRRADLPLHVVDATAGWCEDAWLLASLGCDVLAVERSPVVAALARDGLRRAGDEQSRGGTPGGAERLSIVCGEAAAELRKMEDRPDVVYLDPMFPGGRRATERKPMRVLRMLVGGDDHAGELLAVALHVAARRVVVKRPLRAPDLGGEPLARHKGQAVRYDVYGGEG